MNEIITTETAISPVNENLYHRFLAFIDVRQKSSETYEKALRQFFRYLEEQHIMYPERADVIAWRSALEATGHKPGTIQLYITAVRLFFQWTADEGLYPNIAEHIKGKKIDREHKKDALTAGQAREVLEVIDRSTVTGLRDYAMISLMLTGGLRTIELNRANIEDLRTLSGDCVLFVQGKGHDEKADYVVVPPACEKAIRAYLRERHETDPEAPLFVSHDFKSAGNRLTTRSISRVAKSAMVAAGYDSDRLTAHSLRHTAVTLALLNGVSLEEAREFARHKDISTTLIYDHAIEKNKAKSAGTAAIADALF